MDAQTWADSWGTWHALVTEADESKARTIALAGIRTALTARAATGTTFPDLSVRMVQQKGDQTEYVEWWPGDSGAVLPQANECGECGKLFPDIYPAGRCPYESDHKTDEKVTHYGFLVTVYVRRGMDLDSFSGLANADELGSTVGELVSEALRTGCAVLSVSTERR